MILERLELGPFASNCYILGDESTSEAVIIDPGAEANCILQRINDLGLKVKFIVLTHGHIDHVGAVKEVKEATGAEVAVHSHDAPSLSSERPSSIFGFSFPPPPLPDRLLKEDDTLILGSHQLKVIHTPGHTPGGICLLGEGIVFTGDTLFCLGIGRTDLGGGNYDQLINGIRDKLMVLPDSTIVYPGHGPQSTIGRERQQNPFLQKTVRLLKNPAKVDQHRSQHQGDYRHQLNHDVQ